ncbi:MAG: hypothetical protein JNL88_06285 [Bacteroidia bacterium]|nr:hypothetical protein [Bacteroidia bacterium]
MLRKWIMSAAVCILGGISACTTEPDLDKVPEIKFSTDVQRILSAHCNFSGCHGGGGGEAGSLLTYADVMGYVKGGNAHGSKLYQAITRRGLVAERMPPSGYEEVNAENVKLIYWWIEQGAKNN